MSARYIPVACVALSPLVWPAAAHADVSGALGNIVNMFSGNFGKGMATIAVTVLGIMALYGKMEWKNALITGVGISLMFGAVGIYNQIHNAATGTTTAFVPPTITISPITPLNGNGIIISGNNTGVLNGAVLGSPNNIGTLNGPSGNNSVISGNLGTGTLGGGTLGGGSLSGGNLNGGFGITGPMPSNCAASNCTCGTTWNASSGCLVCSAC